MSLSVAGVLASPKWDSLYLGFTNAVDVTYRHGTIGVLDIGNVRFEGTHRFRFHRTSAPRLLAQAPRESANLRIARHPARIGKRWATRREQSSNTALASLSIGDHTSKWMPEPCGTRNRRQARNRP